MRVGYGLGLFLVAAAVAGGSVATACGSDDQSSPPPKADAGKDTNSASCGNGVVEAGETCDTAIASGTGVCPTVATCDDNDACTVNAVKNGGTCTAACDYSQAATASTSGADGCCPPGATNVTDSDCSALCGNGVVDSGETCDIAITAGSAGACPTSCADDGNPCTVEKLVTANPCSPTCNTTTITAPANGDGCCPAGANGATDTDCTGVCGNGIVEPGEDCDETSASCSQCKWVPTAFRLSSMNLIDPHLYLPASNGCGDGTDAINTGLINPRIQGDTIGAADGGADGILDLSFLLIFRPFNQITSPGKAEIRQGLCAAPFPPLSCDPDPANTTVQTFVYNNQSSGTCLDIVPGTTTSTYTQPVATTAGTDGCSVSDEIPSLTLSIAGISFTFQNARVAGQYVGNPATGAKDGMLRGFMSEAMVDSILLPTSLPAPFGGQPLTILLSATATNGCTTTPDDRDIGPDGTTRGWWFYFNFTGDKVAWTGP